MSYNVLLPNSQDGWWIYKYYKDSRGPHTDWPQRQNLLRQQILKIEPEVLCLQEVSELSFNEDFGFLCLGRKLGFDSYCNRSILSFYIFQLDLCFGLFWKKHHLATWKTIIVYSLPGQKRSPSMEASQRF